MLWESPSEKENSEEPDIRSGMRPRLADDPWCIQRVQKLVDLAVEKILRRGKSAVLANNCNARKPNPLRLPHDHGDPGQQAHPITCYRSVGLKWPDLEG